MLIKCLLGAKKTGFIRDIKENLRLKKYKDAVGLSRELIDLALEGLMYYQNYDRIFLEVVVTLGFLGWIACIAILVIQEHTEIEKETSRVLRYNYSPTMRASVVNQGSVAIAVIIITALAIESAPWMYYAYCLLPVLFWNHVTKRLHIFRAALNYTHIKKMKRRVLFVFLFGTFSLEVLVWSFFRREILSIGLVFFAIWPMTTKLWNSKVAVLCWMTGSLALAVFPALPVVGREANYMLVTIAGVLTILFFGCILFLCSLVSTVLKMELVKYWKVLLGQLLLVAFAVYIVNSTASSLKQKHGLPLLNQLGSWVIFVLSFLLSVINSGNLTIRLSSVALAFSSVYLLMSTAYEGLFLLVLLHLMCAWLICEHKLSGKALCALVETEFGNDGSTGAQQPAWKVLTQGLTKPRVRELNLSDLRCAYFFVFFIIVAFFGTGNIASINSFDPASVYCFLTVFSPFTMGSLLLCKVLIPFIIVSCTFDAIHAILSIPFQSLVLVVLAMTDLMGLHFFYLVQDHGSWLDIGKSISHYVIMMAFIIFLLPIFAMARLFTGASLTFKAIKKRS